MAHKTLIGGTAYEIKGGTTLIDGTAYSIKNGKTLVGGTVYEVGFAPSEATVTITDNGSQYYAYISINGVKYYTAQTITVPIGTTIYCYARPQSSWGYAYISVNSKTVVDADGDFVSYNYTVNGDIAVYLNDFYESCVEITEQ